MNDASDDNANPDTPQLEDPGAGTSTNCDTGLQEDNRTSLHERTSSPEAHSTALEEDVDDAEEEEDNAEDDDNADLQGETPVPPTPIVQSCQPKRPNPVTESEFLVARKTWQRQKGGKSNVIVW